MVLHQHVLNTLLQWLLLLLRTEQPQSWAGTTLEPQVTSSAQIAPQPSWQIQCQDQPNHILTSLLAGSSQSWERLKAKQQRTLGTKEQPVLTLGSSASLLYQQVLSPAEPPTHRSSHLIWTQPGLRRKDQGWYHFSTVGRLEQSTSSHRCRTCSLRTSKDEARAWRTSTSNNPFPGASEHPLQKGPGDPESLRTSHAHWPCPVGYPLKEGPSSTLT